MLADELVAGGTVENEVGTSHRQIVAGGHGSPYVLTNLHAELDTVRGLKNLWRRRYTDMRTSQIQVGGVNVLSRSKPALLIELVIVGQIRLGNDTQDGSALNDDSTVEQQSASLDGHTHDADDVQLAGELHEHHQPLLRLRQQQLFFKKILTTIACNSQFG